MTIDTAKLAREVARVATVRLGWPPRHGAGTEQLDSIVQALAEDANLLPLRLHEEVLTPSIERLGEGPVGQLARIEFGLTRASIKMRYLKERRELALKQLGGGLDALEALEKTMHRAIADDLAFRWKASQPATSRNRSTVEARFAGMTAEERSREEFLETLRRFADRVARQEEEEIMAGEITKEEIEEYEKAPDELTDLELRWQKQKEESR